jgi:hypothetical protein
LHKSTKYKRCHSQNNLKSWNDHYLDCGFLSARTSLDWLFVIMHVYINNNHKVIVRSYLRTQKLTNLSSTTNTLFSVFVWVEQAFLLSRHGQDWNFCSLRSAQWKGINCKQSTRWQHLSRLKASAFFSLQKNLVVMKHSNLYLGLVLPSGGWQSLIEHRRFFFSIPFTFCTLLVWFSPFKLKIDEIMGAEMLSRFVCSVDQMPRRRY